MNYNELPDIKYEKTFNKKSESIKRLIRQSLQILQCLGLPVDEWSERQKEKTAMALLAVGDVKASSEWKKIKDANSDYALTTRRIIEYYNKYLEENISSGSYDDVRRKDLAHMLLGGIVVQSKPSSNTSNPTRGYKISAEYSKLIRNYGQPDWFVQVDIFNKMHPTYKERMSSERELPKIAVKTMDGKELFLKEGEHNIIQKLIIEEFLPRYGYEAKILYLGDSDNKYGLIYEEEKLAELGFSDLRQGILPDIVAYSEKREWIYMIEAYHTSNPITTKRKIEIQNIMGKSAPKAIFVTAFENVTSYKNCNEELAWETEVWIATNPDHIIHRDGSRFLGPYTE